MSHSHSHSHINGDHDHTNCPHDHGHGNEVSPVNEHMHHEEAVVSKQPVDLLIDAIRQGDLDTCKLVALQSPEAIQSRYSNDDATPAHWCALFGELKVMEWLKEVGAPLHERVSRSGMQPLHWACTKGHTDIVRFLLNNGGQIDSLDIKSTPPLVIAAQYDHTILVFFLVRQKADINLLDDCEVPRKLWAARAR